MIRRVRSYLARPGLGPSLVRAVSGSAGIAMLGMGFTFLVGVQLARGLGAEGYGIYGVAMAAAAMLGVPSQFGIPQLLTREVAATHARGDWPGMKGVLHWSRKVVAVSCLLIALALMAWLLAFGPGLSSPLGKTLLLASLLIPLVAFVSIQGATLRGLMQIVLGQVPDTLLRPMLFSALLWLIHVLGVGLTAPTAMACGLAAVAIALVVSSVMLRRHMPPEIANATATRGSLPWLRSSMPMAMTEGARIVQGQVAILALGWLASLSTVGLFRVASSSVALVAMPLTIFNTVAAPVAAKLHATGDRRRLQMMLAYVALGMTASTALLALPFLVAGEAIMSLLFGAEFAGSASCMRILCAGVIANGVFGAGATTLNMLGHPQRVTNASAWAVAALCLLLWPCTAAWGEIGAACAVSAAQAMWSALLWWDTRRLTGLNIGIWAIAASADKEATI